MEKLSLTLFIAFISAIGFAQNAINPYTAKIDSVQNLLNKNLKEDTTKVKRLNDLALLSSFDMQFQRGILAAKQARQISQKIKYPKGEGLYLNFMEILSGGSYLGYYYNLKRPLFYVDIKEKEEPNTLMELFPQNRDPEKVMAKLLEAVKYFEKTNDAAMMAHILVAISVTYQMLNKSDESIEYADRAIKLFKETGRSELAVAISLDKISQLHLSKKSKEANEVENDAKAIIATITDVREKALLNYFLGANYLYPLRKTALGIEYLLKADYELEKMGEKRLRSEVVNILGEVFDNVGMYQKSLDYFNKEIELKIETTNTDDIALSYVSAVFELVPLKRWDEARIYLEKSKSFTNKIKDKRKLAQADARQLDAAGQILMGEGKYKDALQEFLQVNKIAEQWNMERAFSMYMNSYIAQCYQKLGDLKKSLVYAEKSFEQVLTSGDIRLQINASLLLSNVHEELGNTKQAYDYLKKYRDILKEKEEQDIANLTTNLAIENLVQKNEQEKAELEKDKLNQRWWLFSITAALLSSFVFLYFLNRNNQNKQKANAILENTLSQLKSTQNQLIQSEKLASLGELTAGIAHEIQNPLNFVNNFSELNEELANELDSELAIGNMQQAKDIVADIKANSEKINQHGQRASSIVKGMLEHSRKSSGEKTLTDINAICDEYLRLAYHGYRAKDKSFNADFELITDPNLPRVSVIPQDMGRVILNLINNAFYAVNEKSKVESLKSEGVYNPKVTITTQLTANSQLLIAIKDNGLGIPETIKDKIFQPFFTTKPTGQGTGLGLSLAFDIATKGHGGSLEVESKEGEGTEFIIKLPFI